MANPQASKLVDQGNTNVLIPPVVTEVPAIEVPTKFEDLLQDPRIVFKSITGTENRVTAKTIKRIKDKTAMDRARELVRNRLQGTPTPNPFQSSSTLPPNSNSNSNITAFIQAIPAPASTPRPRDKKPKPFSKLGGGKKKAKKGRKKTNKRLKNKNNNSNRQGKSNRKTSPATPTSITTLIRASTTTPAPGLSSSTLSVRDKMVAARNRLRVLMGQKPIGLTTTAKPRPTPSSPTPIDTARQKVLEMLEKKKQAEMAAGSFDAASDPAAAFKTTTSTTASTSTTSREPTEMDLARLRVINELDQQTITVTAKSNIGDLDPAFIHSSQQSPSINPLIQLSPTFPPDSDQLLSLPFQPGTTTTTSTTTTTTTTASPSSLGRPTQPTVASTVKPTVGQMLQEHNEATLKSLDVLDVPTRMQSTLMRLMKKKGLRRDPFAKLVTTAVSVIDTDQDFIDITPPTPKQDPFFPSHQDPLLGQLQGGHDGNRNANLQAPSRRQNPLFRKLQKARNEKIRGLKAPGRKQNPLLRPLTSGHTGEAEGLTVPSRRQNPLLRQLSGGHDEQDVEGLEAPRDPVSDPLFRPAKPLNRFNPDNLDLPNRRQNPLLKILRFDRREKILRKGLSPPRYKQNPLFRQLVSTPQKYRNDFLQLPPRQQNTLLAILRRHGGDNFDADSLLTVPRFKEEFSPTESFADDDTDDYESFDDDVETSPTSPSLPLESTAASPIPQTTVRTRSRPTMRSKFEIMQSKKPVEEVTFQRVNSPVNVEDKKEGTSTYLVE